MRKAHNNNWLIQNGKFVGVNLGADFCAEHEWGIKDLKRILGVNDEDEKSFGIEKRRAKKVKPENVALVENGDILSLLVDGEYSVKSMVENFQKDASQVFGRCDWSMHKEEEFITLWSEGDFCIRVRGDDNKAKLREVHQALVNGKIAIWVGGGGVFQNGGLCLAIIDRVDDQSKKVMYDADKDRLNLKNAAEKTGIRKKIDNYNEQWTKNEEVESGRRCFEPRCGYYALSPKWGSIDGKKTKHPVTFWLNPMRQQENNYGWFTVEELEQWVEGTGPIPMKEKAKIH